MTRWAGQRTFGEVAVDGSPCDSQAGGVGVVQENGLPWLAAYTRPRHEEKVRKFCEDRGIETFLPCRHTVRRWSDRSKRLSQPLFPSYVFLRLDEDRRQRAVHAPGFLWFVRNQTGPVEVDRDELLQLRQVLAGGLECDPLPGVQPGDPVEIVAGPMRGSRGHFERKNNGTIVLVISAIGGAVRVRLPNDVGVCALAKRVTAPRLVPRRALQH